MTNYYAEDLAFVHDTGFGHFANAAAPGLIQRLQKNGMQRGHVVDLGCGSGIWAAALTKHGYQVTGIDFSPQMLEIARVRAPDARFELGSYDSVTIPLCGAVTAIGEVLNYQSDSQLNGLKSLKKLFHRVYEALPTGGLFMFDIAVPGRSAALEDRMRWWEEENWCLTLKVIVHKRKLIRHIVTFRKSLDTYRRDQEVHVLRLYDPDQIKRLLRKTGFRVKTVTRYGELNFPKGLVGYIAKKK